MVDEQDVLGMVVITAVSHCRGRIGHWCGRRDLIFGATPLKARDAIRDICGSRLTSLWVEDDLTADDLHNFFVDKVTRVHDSTDGTPDPVYRQASHDGAFGNFRPVERDDVIKHIMALPDKPCASDPMPTRLLKVCACDMGPFLCWLFIPSLLMGVFPDTLKSV
jgi:hypothetical protein